ncbi:hypothetical protein H4R34_003837 [Dimargaris verticillata]|uniref:Uncharacterized protein n=1 Tax=Dimargaris verticillata TaxID=2761393 RepID=A0A9W8B639_9FUNG|nr:hypothetical protein H4R34_003837 [Dimargaris verticillata]
MPGTKRELLPASESWGRLEPAIPTSTSWGDTDALESDGDGWDADNRAKKKRRRPAYDGGYYDSAADAWNAEIESSSTAVAEPRHNLSSRDIRQLFCEMWDPFPAINMSYIVLHYKHKYGKELVFPYAKLSQVFIYLVAGKFVSKKVTNIEYVFRQDRLFVDPCEQHRKPVWYHNPKTLEQLRRRVATLVLPVSKNINMLEQVYALVYGPLTTKLQVEGCEFRTIREIITYGLETAEHTLNGNGKPVFSERYMEPLLPCEYPVDHSVSSHCHSSTPKDSKPDNGPALRSPPLSPLTPAKPSNAVSPPVLAALPPKAKATSPLLPATKPATSQQIRDPRLAARARQKPLAQLVDMSVVSSSDIVDLLRARTLCADVSSTANSVRSTLSVTRDSETSAAQSSKTLSADQVDAAVCQIYRFIQQLPHAIA